MGEVDAVGFDGDVPFAGEGDAASPFFAVFSGVDEDAFCGVVIVVVVAEGEGLAFRGVSFD